TTRQHRHRGNGHSYVQTPATAYPWRVCPKPHLPMLRAGYVRISSADKPAQQKYVALGAIVAKWRLRRQAKLAVPPPMSVEMRVLLASSAFLECNRGTIRPTLGNAGAIGNITGQLAASGCDIVAPRFSNRSYHSRIDQD